MTATEYNAAQLATGRLTAGHVTELVRFWQAGHGLVADGMAGPVTIASLGPQRQEPISVSGHWLSGQHVTRIDAHPSWYGPLLTLGHPRGIVTHYTATDPGTGLRMAQTRQQPYCKDLKPSISSWHITIDTDGSVIQMVPLDHAAWHAGSPTAVLIPGLGQANYNTVGIELVGHGTEFTDAQVSAAKLVWRALVRRYGIARNAAMIAHQSIDPSRRSDPGPVWLKQHAPGVLDAAYG